MGSETDVYEEVAQALRKARDPADLYERWWVGHRLEGGKADPTQVRNRQPRTHAHEEWTLVRVLQNGTACVARGGETGHVPAGEWLAHQPGKVLVHRRKLWVHGGYLWSQSSRLPSALGARWRIRVYVPALLRGPSKERFETLCEALDEAGCWFEAKTWLGQATRKDQTVIWLSATAISVALEVLAGYLCSAESVPPPPLTLQVLGGKLSLAHDPNPSSSLGLRICGAVATAGDLAAGDRSIMDRWEVACRSFDLVATTPWRHPGPVDPFGIWQALES
jgi:hypothetical protein